MLNIEGVLLHFLVALVPIVIYYMYINEANYFSINAEYVFLLFASISSIILVYYPLMQIGNSFFGFQSLLIVFSFLYGFKRIGIIVLLITFLYRNYIFFPETQWTQHLGLFIYCLPLFFTKYWTALSKKRKYYFSLLLSLVEYVLYMANICLYQIYFEGYSIQNVQEIAGSMVITGMMYSLCFLLMIYISEFFKRTRYLKEIASDTEKMIMVSELAAGVAHEVRNPLTVVKGFVQLVEKDLNEKSKEYMQLVLTELERAEKIITDYLQLAKRYPVEQSIISVTDLLKNVYTIMHSYTNINGVSLQLEIGEEMYIAGDQNKMKQVLLNIIKNATEAIQRGEGVIMVRSYHSNRMAVIEVEDNGIGMTQQELMRIGEAFYTNKETGTGLGVMVTKSIIQEHRGTLLYNSERNKGTTVTIRIPIHNKV